jgi:hypothetical protein
MDAKYLEARFDCAVESLDAGAKLKEDGAANSQKQSISDTPVTQDRGDSVGWDNAYQHGGVK